jgi:hypothetical protein
VGIVQLIPLPKPSYKAGMRETGRQRENKRVEGEERRKTYRERERQEEILGGLKDVYNNNSLGHLAPSRRFWEQLSVLLILLSALR